MSDHEGLRHEINHEGLSCPLTETWERAAAKELADIGHYLAHGLFVNPADFADRLRNTADAIEDAELVRRIEPERLAFPQLEVWRESHPLSEF